MLAYQTPTFPDLYLFPITLLGTVAFVVLGACLYYAVERAKAGVRKPCRLLNFAGTYIWAAVSLLLGFGEFWMRSPSEGFGFTDALSSVFLSALFFASPLIAIFIWLMIAAGVFAAAAVVWLAACLVSSEARRYTKDWYYKEEGQQKIERTAAIWEPGERLCASEGETPD